MALGLLASVMITPGLAEHDELKPLPPVPHLLYTPEENQPLTLGYAVVISPNGGRLNIRDGEGVDLRVHDAGGGGHRAAVLLKSPGGVG